MIDKRTLFAGAMAIAMMTMTVSLFAAETGAGDGARKSEPIYGYRMMTPQERNEFRDRMRNAKSAQERQALRDEHHKQMQARAQERGVTLPERRGGMGPGYGPRGGRGPHDGCAAGEDCRDPGAGMGSGAGMGPGYGPRGGRGPGYGPDDCPAGQNCPAGRAGTAK